MTEPEGTRADGVTLSHLVGSGGRRVPVPVDVAVGITAGILDGIRSRHERDGSADGSLSPEEVVVRADGTIELAEVRRESLRYSAPEVLEGRPSTHASDVYGACVIAWELLSGRTLFAGSNDGEIYGKVLHEPVLPPSLYSAAVTSTLDEIVLRGLSRDPAKRFASAGDMTRALEAVAQGSTPSAVGAWVQELVGDTAVTLPPEMVQGDARVGDTRRRGRGLAAKTAPSSLRRRGDLDARAVWGVGGAACAGLVAVAVWATSTKPIAISARTRPDPSSETPTPSAVTAPSTVTSAPAPSAPVSRETTPLRAKATLVPERRIPPGAPRAHPSPPPTASASCYSLDAVGVWHVRPNCL